MSIYMLVLILAAMWFCIISFSFALFRIPMSNYKKEISISILFLTPVSLLIQVNQWIILTVIVQPILLILCYIFLFKFHWKHAMIIVFCSYIITAALIEPLNNFILSKYNIDEAINLWKNDTSINQWLMIFLQAAIVFIIRKMRWGFTFIRPHSKQDIQINKKTKIAFYIVVVCTFSITLILFFQNQLLIYLFIVITISLMYLLYSAYRKEIDDDL